MQKVILGTVQFGVEYGINNISGIPNDKEISSILNIAKKNKIDILDTALAYGNAEKKIAKFGKNNFRIISKFSNVKKKSDISIFLNNSLKNLKSRSLYAYLFHNADELINKPYLWESLNKLKKDNKIEKIGYSLYNTKQLRSLFKKKIIPDIIQIPFNLFDNRFEKYFEEIKSHNIEIHARSIFLQGLFFKKINLLPKKLYSFKKNLNLINEISQTNDISVNSLALNFVNQNRNIDYIVLGVDKSSHLKENLIHLNQLLSKKVLYKISNIKIKNKELINPSNWN